MTLLPPASRHESTVLSWARWVAGSIKKTLSVGLFLLLAGSLIAVATWLHAQRNALGDTRYESAVRADPGLAAAMVGLLLVVLAGIVYGGGRLGSRNQENKL